MTRTADVLAHVDATLDAALDRLFQTLRIPSISTDPAFDTRTREAAVWHAADLAGIGFDAAVKDTAGHPIVLAHDRTAPGRSLLFYGHYDVQPVDPLSLWNRDPFDPAIEETAKGPVIRARGASDDKGQLMTFIEALRAWKAENGDYPVAITILIEGAEEDGSKFLPEFVEANAAELKADIALVCDTGMWDRQTPAITSSLRGLVFEELVVRCADRDLHSGLFGGAASNPIRVLSRIIADIHDKDGRITIPGFYDGVREPPTQVKEQWRSLGLTPEEFLGQVGLRIPAGERDRMLIEQIQSRPTCDVNGIIGGYTGEGTKTVIAGQASCKISFRLVDDQDPAAISRAFEAFVRERIPADCSVELIRHKGSRAIALPFDMPDLTRAQAALHAEWGKAPVTIGSGGSIPIVGDFKRMLGMDTLLIGFGLDDDRVHSPNEKYDLSSFHKGTRSWARILAALAG